jgi:chemotaxis regulatin CheY-phosphate phosphatase CheZ
MDLITKPWRDRAAAKRALEQTRAARPAADRMADTLRRIQQENHITARIHRAARGEQ